MNKKPFYITNSYYKNSVETFMSRPTLYIFVFLLLFPIIGSAQVGINTPTDGSGSPIIDPSAVLQMDSTDKGVLFPRLTIAQRTAMVEAAKTEGGLPPGLTFYCSDCCKNGEGAMYYYNSVKWRTIDNTCEDLFECMDGVITIDSPNRMDTVDTPPLLIDGSIILADQASSGDCRMNRRNQDIVLVDFPQDLLVGYKIRLYFSDNERPRTAPGVFQRGIYASPMRFGVGIGQDIDTRSGLLPGSVLTSGPLGNNDHYVTITLTQITDQVRVRTSVNGNGKIRLLEIKTYDNLDVEIPLTCN